jgi:hypothetical protein
MLRTDVIAAAVPNVNFASKVGFEGFKAFSSKSVDYS